MGTKKKQAGGGKKYWLAHVTQTSDALAIATTRKKATRKKAARKRT